MEQVEREVPGFVNVFISEVVDSVEVCSAPRPSHVDAALTRLLEQPEPELE